MNKKLCVIFAILLILVSSSNALALGDMGILATFCNPNLDSRPMARMWFVDAVAGSIDNDVIEPMISKMAKGGMGGVELQFLSDAPQIKDVNFAAQYGWGSENWVNLLKKVFNAALKVEEGFKVDLTITSHWPPALNTIDPNDIGASQELSYAVTDITQQDITNGFVALLLPETKKIDGGNNPFIFTDTLVSGTLTRFIDSEEIEVIKRSPFGEEKLIKTVKRYSADKMIDVTNAISGKIIGKAGVPDAQTLMDVYGGEYSEDDVAARFGRAPAEGAELPDGKRTSEGLRARMADSQYAYTLALNGLNVEVGDSIVAVYRRGTGQLRSGGGSYTMPYLTYATNYFAAEGMQEIINYWNKNIFSNTELVSLMKANAKKTGGMCIFEDSIEASHTMPFWAANLLNDCRKYLGYDYSSNVALLAADASGDFVFIDENGNKIDVTRIKEDYTKVLIELFNANHMMLAKDWMHNKLEFDVDYRIQAYGIKEMGFLSGALMADIAEGDNSTAGDDDRTLSTALSLSSNNILSQEALTTIKQQLTWKIAAADVNNHASSGINRVIFHGSSYPVCFDEGFSGWPGWNWGGMTNYGESFNSWNNRTPWWDDAKKITDYVSRQQAINQNGTARVDIAIMTNRSGSTTSFQSLLDSGYNYNIMSEEIFMDSLVDQSILTVKDGMLYKDGPGYRAMIISNLEAIEPVHLKRIISFAQAGLPVIVEGTMPKRTYGTENLGEDSEISLLMAELIKMDNVRTVIGGEELPVTLAELGVNSSARYIQAGVQATHRFENSGEYYMLYNANDEQVRMNVTLIGNGVPFILNMWTGEIQAVAQYETVDDGISLPIEIESDETVVIALAPKDGELAAIAGLVGDKHVSKIEVLNMQDGVGNSWCTTFPPIKKVNRFDAGKAIYINGTPLLRVTEANEFLLTIGAEERTVSVGALPTVPELYTWTLILNSFGPDKDANAVDPTISKITTIMVDNVATGTLWKYLPTNNAEKLGVENMEDVSGTGIYETTFFLPDDWKDEEDGAYLKLTYCDNDILTSVAINDIPVKDLNALHEYVDLGHNLHAGQNTLKVQIATTLVNRGMCEGGQTKTPMDNRVTHGLLTCELAAYKDIRID